VAIIRVGTARPGGGGGGRASHAALPDLLRPKAAKGHCPAVAAGGRQSTASCVSSAAPTRLGPWSARFLLDLAPWALERGIDAREPAQRRWAVTSFLRPFEEGSFGRGVQRAVWKGRPLRPPWSPPCPLVQLPLQRHLRPSTQGWGGSAADVGTVH
jgi:hypothetical protein